MRCSRALHTFIAAATLAALAAGCATVEQAPAATPRRADARAGPVVRLLGPEVAPDAVRVISGPDGLAHVFVVSRKLRQVLQVSVTPDGDMRRTLVRTDVSPWSVDAAFDPQGRLHLLLDTDLLVLTDGVWTASDRTPWQAAGLKAKSARFVAGAPALIWAFQVDGREFGAPRRVEVYGFGGGPAGLIWPWFTRGSRAVFVTQLPSRFGPWVVLEPQGTLNTFPVGLAADQSAHLYVLYERSSSGIAGDISYRYAPIDAAVLRGAAGQFANVVDTRIGDRQVRAVTGVAAQIGRPAWGDGSRVAVDQTSGTVLVGTDFLVRGETWTGPLHWPLGKTLRVDVVPAGDETFHALAVGSPHDPWWGNELPIYYLYFSGAAWSGAMELGLSVTKSFLGKAWHSVGIASAGNDKAFLVWPTANGLLGRWVERSR